MLKKKGFTLIEIVYVLVIIGTLAAVVMVSMKGHMRHAKEKGTIRSIEQLFEASVAWAGTQVPVSYTGLNLAALQAGDFIRAGYAGTNPFGGTIAVTEDPADNMQVQIVVTDLPTESCTNLNNLYTTKAESSSCAGDGTLTIFY